MKCATAACLVLSLARASHADPTELRPITEVDVYRGMAELWELAGMEQSLIVGAGAGYQHDSFATLDLAYRRKNLHSAWDLVPTTVASGVWQRDGHAQLPFAVGWQLPLGLFSAPYLVADGVAAWTPAASRLEAGFDVGVGYEWRVRRSWSVDADFRLVGLWSAAGSRLAMDESPWGVRAIVSVRRYFGE